VIIKAWKDSRLSAAQFADEQGLISDGAGDAVTP
jgi:hypothetical protein